MTVDRPFPLEPLARVAGITLGIIGGRGGDDAPGGVAELADRLGISASTVKRLRHRGLDQWEADQYAARLGTLPQLVWGDLWDLTAPESASWGAAAANAAKTHCPQGHPYDGVDNRGARICTPCRGGAVARFRQKKQNTQAETLITCIDPAQPSLWEAS